MQEMPETRVPWVGKKWQPTAVFLTGKFHGQRRLADYSPWGCEESNTTEQLSTHTHHEQLRIYSKNLTLLAATWKAALVMSFFECSPKFSVSITHA